MSSLPKAKLESFMQTDVGMVRDHNEDSAYMDDQYEFFAVADGMGGHAAGEVASKMAVEEVRDALGDHRNAIESFRKAPDSAKQASLVAMLEQAVRKAHGAVFECGTREADKKGMGTTLDVVLVAGSDAFVAHVGDSRTYLVRNGKAAQVTMDHTVAEVLVMEGKLSAEEAVASPLRTILVNAVGVAPEVSVEMAHIELRAGDKLLICSDGLHDYFPKIAEIGEKVSKQKSKAALNDLVELSKERGGHDNITGIIVDVIEVPPPWRTPRSSGGRAASDDTLPVDEEEIGSHATLVGISPSIIEGPRSTDDLATLKMPALKMDGSLSSDQADSSEDDAPDEDDDDTTATEPTEEH